MNISSVYNNQIDIQSLLTNNINGSQTNSNDVINRTAYYAQKSEPMYMVEMDLDEDGKVTLDEFKDYCKSNNISTRNMIRMSQTASSYRIMKSEAEAIDYISKLIPNVFPKLKQSGAESGYLKQEENQYNISNDPNSNQNVSYKEYIEYCEQNSFAFISTPLLQF